MVFVVHSGVAELARADDQAVGVTEFGCIAVLPCYCK
jgi:hypothetical protein